MDKKNSFALEELKKLKKNNLKIIDIGCGEGELCNRIDALEKGHKVIGIDISNKRIKKAKEFYPHLDFYNTNADKIDYSKFDVVFSMGVFEYTSFNLIEKIAKEMKEDALIIFSVPNMVAFRRRVKSLLGLNPNPSKFLTYCFTKKRLSEILKGKFKEIKISGNVFSEQFMGVLRK